MFQTHFKLKQHPATTSTNIDLIDHTFQYQKIDQFSPTNSKVKHVDIQDISSIVDNNDDNQSDQMPDLNFEEEEEEDNSSSIISIIEKVCHHHNTPIKKDFSATEQKSSKTTPFSDGQISIDNETSTTMMIPLDPENSRRCVSCKKLFQNQYSVKTHYQNVHLRLMHKCPINGCPARLPSKRSRDRHAKNKNLHKKLLQHPTSAGKNPETISFLENKVVCRNRVRIQLKHKSILFFV